MGRRGQDARDRDAEERRRALPWRERYDWHALLLFAAWLGVVAFSVWLGLNF